MISRDLGKSMEFATSEQEQGAYVIFSRNVGAEGQHHGPSPPLFSMVVEGLCYIVVLPIQPSTGQMYEGVG